MEGRLRAIKWYPCASFGPIGDHTGADRAGHRYSIIRVDWIEIRGFIGPTQRRQWVSANRAPAARQILAYNLLIHFLTERESKNRMLAAYTTATKDAHTSCCRICYVSRDLNYSHIAIIFTA